MNNLMKLTFALLLVLGAAAATAPVSDAEGYRDGQAVEDQNGYDQSSKGAYRGEYRQHRRYAPRRGVRDEGRYRIDRQAGGRRYELACSSRCRRACAAAYRSCRASRRVCLAQRSACLRSCGC